MTTEISPDLSQSETAQPSRDATDSQKVWDAQVRIFHWLNVVAVILLAFTGFVIMYSHLVHLGGRTPELAMKTLHASIGYLVIANLTVRIIWGFVGSQTARWSAILPRKAVRRQFVSDLIGAVRRRPGASLSRLFFSRVVTTLMLAIFLTMAASGLFRAGTDLYHPPFGPLFQSYLAAPGVDPASLEPAIEAGADPDRWRFLMKFKSRVIGKVHRWGAYSLLFLAALHIAGAIMTDARSGGGVIGPMFTGVRARTRMRMKSGA